MPILVPVAPKSIEEYRPIIGDAKTDEIIELAKPLQGSRVLHLNATSFGGGVAEILHTLIPLLRSLGIEVDWKVMEASGDFFNVSKQMHNALQGMFIPWNTSMGETWKSVNRANADTLDGAYDFAFIHDPQPAGILQALTEQGSQMAIDTRWIWRCHLDTTESLPEVWDFLRPAVQLYDAVIYTKETYVNGSFPGVEMAFIPPAIDPLSTKNIELSPDIIRDVLQRYSIDPNRPIMAQISRFDPWKDPLGVVDVYRALKYEHRDLQLLMVASMADDDPEAWSFYERIVRRAGEDYDIHVLTNLNGVANLEVNAFQRAADVVLQKSTREGFGLVISEALWKGRPVVAGAVGGIPMQMANGRAGRLGNSTADFIEHVGELLENPGLREEMGLTGREHVRENFLTTRLLADHLRLMLKIQVEPAEETAPTSAKRRTGSRRRAA